MIWYGHRAFYRMRPLRSTAPRITVRKQYTRCRNLAFLKTGCPEIHPRSFLLQKPSRGKLSATTAATVRPGRWSHLTLQPLLDERHSHTYTRGIASVVCPAKCTKGRSNRPDNFDQLVEKCDLEHSLTDISAASISTTTETARLSSSTTCAVYWP